MEQAYFDARTHGCSRAPIVEMLIPSTVDSTLAPPGKHVASLFCQHFAYDLPNGLDWDAIREPAADLVIDTVTRYAPNFKGAVLGRKILSPLDLEREFGLTGGDIFHGALTLDQIWSARPVLGHADYRAPVRRALPVRGGHASRRRRVGPAGAQRRAGNRARPEETRCKRSRNWIMPDALLELLHA